MMNMKGKKFIDSNFISTLFLLLKAANVPDSF